MEGYMKVLAINGSARKDSNTAILIKIVLAELENEGIETELIQIAGRHIHGCKACYKCIEKMNRQCINNEDMANELIEKMSDADGIILGSPTYVCNISSELKALIDRACIVGKANGDMFKRKVGAAVSAVRRSGAIPALNAINVFFQISQVFITSSSYWNMGFGMEKGDVESDEEGIQTMKTLGVNMAWLLKKIHA
jgi:multimeric flavodoxin WrbA